MASYSIDMDRFSLDDLLASRQKEPDYNIYWKMSFEERSQLFHDRENSRLVLAQPALVGYLMSEVEKGRSEFIEGQTKEWVFRYAMNALKKPILEEGGDSFIVYPEQYSDTEIAAMRIGRFIITHQREWQNYNGDSDVRGPSGTAGVKGYESPDAAAEQLENMQQTLKGMYPEAIIRVSEPKITA